MNKLTHTIQKNKQIFVIGYITIIMLLLGMLAYSYAKNRPLSEPEEINEADTGAEDYATLVPDENALNRPLTPQIPEDIKDIRSALPFTSRRFNVIYNSTSDNFVVELKQEFNDEEKKYVRDWFERFPEFDDGESVKIIWIDKTNTE